MECFSDMEWKNNSKTTKQVQYSIPLPHNDFTRCNNMAGLPVGTMEKLLKVALIKFRSIMNRKADLLQFIATHDPHLIVGIETWLSTDLSNNEIIPSDFKYNSYL